MNVTQVFTLGALVVVGACIGASPTIPIDVPWYVHTAVAGLQFGATAALLAVDPADLGKLTPHG